MPEGWLAQQMAQSIRTYRLEFVVDSKTKVYTHGEEVVKVSPSSITRGSARREFATKIETCTKTMCHGIALWESGNVTYKDMQSHLGQHHPGIKQVRC